MWVRYGEKQMKQWNADKAKSLCYLCCLGDKIEDGWRQDNLREKFLLQILLRVLGGVEMCYWIGGGVVGERV